MTHTKCEKLLKALEFAAARFNLIGARIGYDAVINGVTVAAALSDIEQAFTEYKADAQPTDEQKPTWGCNGRCKTLGCNCWCGG